MVVGGAVTYRDRATLYGRAHIDESGTDPACRTQHRRTHRGKHVSVCVTGLNRRGRHGPRAHNKHVEPLRKVMPGVGMRTEWKRAATWTKARQALM